MELTEQTIEEIRNLTFDCNAQIIVAVNSLGTVYWSDEIANARFLLCCTDLECDQIRKLFAIRDRYWNTGTIGLDDQLYWEESRNQFPNWPIFQRLEPSIEQRKELDVAKEQRKFLVEIVFSLADEIEVSEQGGVEYRSAIFKRESFLKKKRKRRGWRWWGS